jgi:hypothetical protein
LGIFHNGVIGAADLEGTLTGADVESGDAMQFAFKDQFADQS